MKDSSNEMKESSNFLDQKAMEGCSSLEIKRNVSEAAEISKKRKRVLFSDSTPKHHSNNKIEKHTSGTKNFSMRVQLRELEMAVEEARLEISHHFENMEKQVDNNYKAKVREVETWTRGALANIEGGTPPQNDFFIKRFVDNFEEVIKKMDYESKRDVNHSMDGIRKIIVKLVKRINQSFTPKPFVDNIPVKRGYIANCVWVTLWSLVAVLIYIYPNLTTFETIIATQFAIFILCLFYILYFYSNVFK